MPISLSSEDLKPYALNVNGEQYFATLGPDGVFSVPWKRGTLNAPSMPYLLQRIKDAMLEDRLRKAERDAKKEDKKDVGNKDIPKKQEPFQAYLTTRNGFQEVTVRGKANRSVYKDQVLITKSNGVKETVDKSTLYPLFTEEEMVALDSWVSRIKEIVAEVSALGDVYNNLVAQLPWNLRRYHYQDPEPMVINAHYNDQSESFWAEVEGRKIEAPSMNALKAAIDFTFVSATHPYFLSSDGVVWHKEYTVLKYEYYPNLKSTKHSSDSWGIFSEGFGPYDMVYPSLEVADKVAALKQESSNLQKTMLDWKTAQRKIFDDMLEQMLESPSAS